MREKNSITTKSRSLSIIIAGSVFEILWFETFFKKYVLTGSATLPGVKALRKFPENSVKAASLKGTMIPELLRKKNHLIHFRNKVVTAVMNINGIIIVFEVRKTSNIFSGFE